MKRLLSRTLAAMLLVSAIAFPAAAETPDAKAIAQQLFDRLDAHQYDAAAAGFSEQMRATVPAERQVWESLPVQAGAAKGRGEPRLQAQGEMTVVDIPLHYANVELVAKIAIDANGQIIGCLIQPAPPPAVAVTTDAAYAELRVRQPQAVPETLSTAARLPANPG